MKKKEYKKGDRILTKKGYEGTVIDMFAENAVSVSLDGCTYSENKWFDVIGLNEIVKVLEPEFLTPEGVYQKLLESAPSDHNSQEFKVFLTNNNKVRAFTRNWLIIENCKYWDKNNDWLTAFYIDGDEFGSEPLEGLDYLEELPRLIPDFDERVMLLKPKNKRTVDLFHVHIYKDVNVYGKDSF